MGLVSDDAETAVRDAAGVDQTGSAAASRGRMAAGETAAEIAAENEKCQTCGGSSIDLNTCDKNECMGLGPCYYTESTVGIPGQVPVAGEYGVRTYNDQCYSCAKAESCSNFNDNREMCIAPARTNRAGLNCEWDESENICRAKAAAQEASETPAATSAPAESTETENSDAAKCANNLGLCETQCSSSQTPMPSFNEDCIAGKKCCAPLQLIYKRDAQIISGFVKRSAVHRKHQCLHLTMNAPKEMNAACLLQPVYKGNAQAISGFVKRNALHRKRQLLHLTLIVQQIKMLPAFYNQYTREMRKQSRVL